MRKILPVLAFFGLIGCGSKKEEKKEGFEMNRSKKEVKNAVASQEIPIDMDNKGIGPITSVSFGDTIDKGLVAKGEAIFSANCTACHMVDQRMIGPAMKGVYERRSPEWVMNMILNPNGMLREDPIAKALLKEYNNAIMMDQRLTQEEARAVAEYLRTL